MFDDLRNFIDISAEEYHADKEILGHSALVEILKSPKHYFHRISNPHVPTASLEFGTALHAALLEPERFAETYIVSPKFDRRTKEGKADAAAWEEAHKGAVSVDEAELKKLQGMQKAVLEHSGAKKLLSKCYVEMSYFWTDEDTGFQCRVRPDVLALDDQGDVIAAIDVKSTSNASKDKFQKSVMDYGYDLNAAFYSDAIERAIGRRVPYYFLLSSQPSHMAWRSIKQDSRCWMWVATNIEVPCSCCSGAGRTIAGRATNHLVSTKIWKFQNGMHVVFSLKTSE